MEIEKFLQKEEKDFAHCYVATDENMESSSRRTTIETRLSWRGRDFS